MPAFLQNRRRLNETRPFYPPKNIFYGPPVSSTQILHIPHGLFNIFFISCQKTLILCRGATILGVKKASRFRKLPPRFYCRRFFLSSSFFSLLNRCFRSDFSPLSFFPRRVSPFPSHALFAAPLPFPEAKRFFPKILLLKKTLSSPQGKERFSLFAFRFSFFISAAEGFFISPFSAVVPARKFPVRRAESCSD